MKQKLTPDDLRWLKKHHRKATPPQPGHPKEITLAERIQRYRIGRHCASLERQGGKKAYIIEDVAKEKNLSKTYVRKCWDLYDTWKRLDEKYDILHKLKD